MTDHFWVEFRHIPIEIQAAFLQDFGEKYDILDFIDPLLATWDDYMTLAINKPDAQPLMIDDVIPYRVGDKEYKVHTAHKLRPWCFKCQSYNHLYTDHTCPHHPSRQRKETGRLIRDPFDQHRWRTVDPGTRDGRTARPRKDPQTRQGGPGKQLENQTWIPGPPTPGSL
jgi:hypothetical protein